MTLFTDAPHEVLLAALGRVEAQWDEPQPADAAVRAPHTIAAFDCLAVLGARIAQGCRGEVFEWGCVC